MTTQATSQHLGNRKQHLVASWALGSQPQKCQIKSQPLQLRITAKRATVCRHSVGVLERFFTENPSYVKFTIKQTCCLLLIESAQWEAVNCVSKVSPRGITLFIKGISCKRSCVDFFLPKTSKRKPSFGQI